MRKFTNRHFAEEYKLLTNICKCLTNENYKFRKKVAKESCFKND